MPVARPSDMLDWGGIPIEPTTPQKASGFAVSQNVPAEAFNWLLQNIDSWIKYAVDYIDTTYPAAKALAGAGQVFGVPHPMRTLAAAATMTFASVSAAVNATGALQHVVAVGVAGKTLRFDVLTQAIASSTWGLATDCNDIAYGNSRYLACGATGKVRTSTDGSTWSAYFDVGGTSALSSIAFSADRTLFCAVGTDSGGTNGTTVTGNGVVAPTQRALPVVSDVPRRVVWVGGAVQAFYVFTNTAVYASPDPTTTAFVQVGTYSAFTTVLDACWHPDIGIFVLGIIGGAQLRYVWSPTGAAGSWVSQQSGYNATPLAANLLALPGKLFVFVSYGSTFASVVFPIDTIYNPDAQPWADSRYVLPARPARAKVLHNSVYVVGMRSATDGSIFVSAPLESIRTYSRG